MSEEKKLTGYPSIDKPWLKYYSEEAINAEIPECSAYDYIYNVNKEHYDKSALDYFGKHITFREMFQKIEQCAQALKAYGVKEGDVISVSLPNIPEAVYLFYAISKIGAVANMIDPRTSKECIESYVNETNSKLLFVIDIIKSKVADFANTTCVENIILVSAENSLPWYLHIIFKIKKGVPKSSNEAHFMNWKLFLNKTSDKYGVRQQIRNISDLPVMIVHTGGTTGSPKGVMLSNKNINAIPFQSMQFPTDLQSCHKWLDIMPPFIAYGIGSGLHFPLAVGMEVILIPKFKPEEFDRMILKYKPNHISGVPSHWHNIIHSKKLKNKDLSFLITCAVGGDSMNVELEREANIFLKQHNCNYSIVKGYGMTEVNGSIGRTLNENNPVGSVGIPFAHSSIKICNPESREELSYNQIGEIYMTGPSIMIGYYDNPAETKLTKIKDENNIEWIRSGDLGYMTEEGNIFIEDRIKRMIIRHDGFKIFPSMIENTIIKGNEVTACCAVGAPDKTHSQGKIPIVFVVANSNDYELMKKKLFNLCKKELPEYALPCTFVFVNALPLTPIGKVDYKALEKQAKEIAY